MDTPDSPLSDVRTDEFDMDTPHSGPYGSASPEPEVDILSGPPAKRQKTNSKANRRSNIQTNTSNMATFDAHEDNSITNIPSDADISSDTEGSVPGSPHLPAIDEEGDAALGGKEQVSVCRWDGCEAGDLGNMDILVKHLHEEHIHARQKKYSCEWIGCNRKGIAHASGYALRAHMRSHTREKPFFCTLPECDRSFTRSDALAKHMRTVHETEALRPSDPVPKHHSSNPQNRAQRLRITFNKFSAGGPDDPNSPVSSKAGPGSPPLPPNSSVPPGENEYERNNVSFIRDDMSGDWIAQFPSDVTFTSKELDLRLPQLLTLLKKQIEWAHDEGEQLRQETHRLEQIRKSEWIAKEVVLRDFMDDKVATAELQEAEAEQNRANDGAYDNEDENDNEEGEEIDVNGVAETSQSQAVSFQEPPKVDPV